MEQNILSRQNDVPIFIIIKRNSEFGKVKYEKLKTTCLTQIENDLVRITARVTRLQAIRLR